MLALNEELLAILLQDEIDAIAGAAAAGFGDPVAQSPKSFADDHFESLPGELSDVLETA